MPTPVNSCTRTQNGSPEFCAALIVDINGTKGPNCMGRDVFRFIIKKQNVLPEGANGTPYPWSKTSPDYCDETDEGNNGEGCAGRIMIEGEMTY